MLFVKANDLKQGMRLAKPIYNKNGVLLYGRDTKLTEQGIASIKNFELIGIYILEPAEPLPPMSDEDIEFERFQTMAVFCIKDDLRAILSKREPENLYKMADMIMNTYGKDNKKVNFTQNLRSPSDYVYKHSLNVAILSVLIGKAMHESTEDIKDLVISALIHDLGLLLVNEKIACSDETNEEEKENIKRRIIEGYERLEYINVSHNVKRLVAAIQRETYDMGNSGYSSKDRDLSNSFKILMLADKYDRLTAMKLDVEPVSEFIVIKKLLEDSSEDKKVVNALISSINILVPGVCVELNNGKKGLVLAENENNVLRPVILRFDDNKIYVLENMNDSFQIKDIMKTMDNRTVIDKKLLEEYM